MSGTVPEDRIKGRDGHVTDFRVPLSTEAMRIVDELRPLTVDSLLLPGNTGRPITSAAVEKSLRGLNEAGLPHGFRTSFRTWAQDNRACDRDISETILGHVVGNKVERTYARSDLLDLRRPVMEAWARFVTGAESADVIPLRPVRAKQEPRGGTVVHAGEPLGVPCGVAPDHREAGPRRVAISVAMRSLSVASVAPSLRSVPGMVARR
jgi:hypothetical protein